VAGPVPRASHELGARAEQLLITDSSTPTDAPVVTDSMAIDAIVQPVADIIDPMGTGAGGSLFNAVLIA
jgi:hypothetical protein